LNYTRIEFDSSVFYDDAYRPKPFLSWIQAIKTKAFNGSM